MGRLLNHSKKCPNVMTRVMELGGATLPSLCLIARRDIEVGEELVYDYGERRGEVVAVMPWLAS
jgi:histone-lysine N-methyltransferase SETD8